jgi:hypothetical protein
MAQQTAVNWLEDNLIGNPFSEKDFEHNRNVFRKAKAMEREQIIDAYNQNITGFDKLEQEEIGLNWAEEYYNQTYKPETTHH